MQAHMANIAKGFYDEDFAMLKEAQYYLNDFFASFNESVREAGDSYHNTLVPHTYLHQLHKKLAFHYNR